MSYEAVMDPEAFLDAAERIELEQDEFMCIALSRVPYIEAQIRINEFMDLFGPFDEFPNRAAWNRALVNEERSDFRSLFREERVLFLCMMAAVVEAECKPTRAEKKLMRQTLEISVDGEPRVIYGPYSFKRSQEFVEGYVERTRTITNNRICMMHVNENGIAERKPLNYTATMHYQAYTKGRDCIYGNAVIGLNHEFGE